MSDNMHMQAGIDEAGRGALIGPLVVAIVIGDKECLSRFKNMNIRDSKLIAPRVREKLYEEIIEMSKECNLKYEIIQISPKTIDEALQNPNLNLNSLEGFTMIELINKHKPDEAILDCPSTNTKAFKSFVESHLKYKPKLIVEHKADNNYLAAGAASILAKVTRDREINKLSAKHGDLGSGYPSDPKTRAFLLKNWNKLDIFRKEWSSYKKVAEEKKQSKLGGF